MSVVIHACVTWQIKVATTGEDTSTYLYLVSVKTVFNVMEQTGKFSHFIIKAALVVLFHDILKNSNRRRLSLVCINCVIYFTRDPR